MSLRINQNIDALNSYRNLSVTQGQMSKSLEKLSSGYRINRAADDAAGLAISEGLRSQVGGIKVAVRNAQDGVSVVQTAEGALTETHSILQRMRDLSVQASNDSNDTNSRNAIKSENDALASELDRIASSTTFNNVKLLDGNYTNKNFQVGYSTGPTDSIAVSITQTGSAAAYNTFANGAASTTAATATFTIGAVTATTGTLVASTDANNIAGQLNNDSAFNDKFTASVDDKGGLVIAAKDAAVAGSIAITGTGLGGANTATAQAAGSSGFSAGNLGVSGLLLDTATNAKASTDKLDTAIKSVSTARANLGAMQNRFEHTINNLNVTQENLSASESRIRDTDMASEMMSFTRSQILSQAGTAMLAQANQAPQGVLSLLR
ncbi:MULTISPECIES: flagellin [unclassified Nocardioides]|uniref:flagellin N-terminal helical domain-containing protein n=1 Tax=unclassified Nocardioides TaxID=2615069 RepID=UPI0009F0E5D6|nr:MULTISPECIES: flagellin [unclassified Nocardioides]GAW51205.1 flagellin domain-containing protein [Nocardioides sp. PD653-B2]GAW56933.1 flagellin domain-containing protein [Nocardioides sp. PD653]